MFITGNWCNVDNSDSVLFLKKACVSTEKKKPLCCTREEHVMEVLFVR